MLWPRDTGLRVCVADCTGEAEVGSGPPQLMKQGNISCNHSIYSKCWKKWGMEGTKSCKIRGKIRAGKH